MLGMVLGMPMLPILTLGGAAACEHRTMMEAVFEEELDARLGRIEVQTEEPVKGYRHGCRHRQITSTTDATRLECALWPASGWGRQQQPTALQCPWLLSTPAPAG